MVRASAVGAASAILLVLLAWPRLSLAHPMGNFSVNHYTKIVTDPDRVQIDYIIDMAEIPTFQEMQRSGIVPRVDDPGVARYLKTQSANLKQGLTLTVGGAPLVLETVSRQALFPPGAGGLPTMKMGFVYWAHLDHRLVDGSFALHYQDSNFPDHAGWKEIVAVRGPGTRIDHSSVPSQDRSLELTNYPTDMLHSPPQVLSADLTFAATPAGTEQLADRGSNAGWLDTGAEPGGLKLAANKVGTPRSAFTDLIESNRVDVTFLLMAALIAAVLGGFHALEPGHGKTLVAAYLVGSRGGARHAVFLGGIVTASHTISVYALGIITLYASQWIMPEQLYPWLGAASGLLVAGLGLTLFLRRYLTEPTDSHHADHSYGHEHRVDAEADHDHAPSLEHRHTWWGGHVSSTHSHNSDHSRSHDQGHSHHHGHQHVHEPRTLELALESQKLSVKSLFVLGVTGGIVPCPAALVVLLAALAFHRVAFGLFLIVAFSAGLAAVLITFGLAMVYAGRFMSRFGGRGPLTERWLPLASSAVITIVGVGLTLQSLIVAGVLHVRS
ncbi:MAG TPA: sulfite exporter TauE/SafE family protein [Candidatus Binataceae bacterium]|nr:sulfite exporter TauE/SafE family protein [Candidatus Binataceae bacterium]